MHKVHKAKTYILYLLTVRNGHWVTSTQIKKQDSASPQKLPWPPLIINSTL
jgi:hypothetical protein